MPPPTAAAASIARRQAAIRRSRRRRARPEQTTSASNSARSDEAHQRRADHQSLYGLAIHRNPRPAGPVRLAAVRLRGGASSAAGATSPPPHPTPRPPAPSSSCPAAVEIPSADRRQDHLQRHRRDLRDPLHGQGHGVGLGRCRSLALGFSTRPGRRKPQVEPMRCGDVRGGLRQSVPASLAAGNPSPVKDLRGSNVVSVKIGGQRTHRHNSCFFSQSPGRWQ